MLQSVLAGIVRAECGRNNMIGSHQRTFSLSPHRKPALCGLFWEEGDMLFFCRRLQPLPSLEPQSMQTEKQSHVNSSGQLFPPAQEPQARALRFIFHLLPSISDKPHAGLPFCLSPTDL